MVQQPWWWLALALGPVLYWSVSPARRHVVLAITGAAFLLLADAYAVPMLLLLVLVWRLTSQQDDATRKRDALAVAIGAIVMLAAFKTLGAGAVVPLGLSYLVFRVVHVALDVRRGAKLPVGIAEWLAWATFAPIASAGPIERLDHFRKGLPAAFSWVDVHAGVSRIMVGLTKKAVIVELLLVPNLPQLHDIGTLSMATAWQFAAINLLYGYIDFSSYCDVAIGGARLFGIKVVENFEWPLLAGDIASFWRRWHISLMQWCQAYVYMPLLGWTRSPYAATYGTFLVVALWHDVSMNWLAWGLYHATGVAIAQKVGAVRRARRVTFIDRAPLVYARPVGVFIFLCFASAITGTKAQGLAGALQLIACMLGI